MFENPLTLGGLGLLSGGGWDGAMSGMRMGAGMQDRRRQQDAFDGLLSGSNVDQGMLPLLKAMGPEKGIEFLAQQRDPMRQMQLKQAQANLAQTNAETGMLPLRQQLLRAQIAATGRRSDGPLAEFEARKVIAEQLGMQPGTPQYQTYVATGKTGRDETLTASDRKMIHQSEDEAIAVDDTIARLERARELNNATNQGWFSDTRATLSNNLPGWMVPDAVSSPESGEATREYSDLMNLEATKEMSETLKGASTDREMAKFMEIIADTSKPREIRQRALDRMLDIGRRKKALVESRSRDLRGGSYYKPGYTPDGVTPGAPEQPAAPQTRTINGKTYINVDGQWFEQ